MDDALDDFARKAGEALVAAGRAPTPEQRERHREFAQLYQEKMRGLRKRDPRSGPAAQAD